MNYFNQLRESLSQLLAPKDGERSPQAPNPYNDAFLFGSNGHFTRYDPLAPTYIEKGYNINPIVFAVVDQMARKTAAIPMYIREVKDVSALQKMRNMDWATKGAMTMQQQIRRAILENKAYEKEDLPFLLLKLLAPLTFKPPLPPPPPIDCAVMPVEVLPFA
jgi:hypothetical protein